jgi:hypothetical protein
MSSDRKAPAPASDDGQHIFHAMLSSVASSCVRRLYWKPNRSMASDMFSIAKLGTVTLGEGVRSLINDSDSLLPAASGVD